MIVNLFVMIYEMSEGFIFYLFHFLPLRKNRCLHIEEMIMRQSSIFEDKHELLPKLFPCWGNLL